jgi:hypothetical protein
MRACYMQLLTPAVHVFLHIAHVKTPCIVAVSIATGYVTVSTSNSSMDDRSLLCTR